MYKKVLIANRGEIAVRIVRACKELGIRTVAVFSDADRNSLHVNLSDESFNIGKSLPSESYLVSAKIIEVAKKSKCDAIHPGYGFLSENADFAKTCMKNKIDFIGPSPESIRLMGDKITSREIAKAARVPLVPGTDGEVNNNEALDVAKKIGFPLMIKATAGGGGKGMRLVQKEEDFESSLRMAKSEAQSAFNNDVVFIEKFIEKPRHIEIQVLGDKKGNVVHLFERECSIQRRHQKVVEEAPSPGVSEKTRQKMGKIAVRLAKKVSYYGAGTIEFIMDQKENFYFLEMNTRVQVEHPITEMITGIDIVKEMIKISCGNKLSFKQADISRKGHAIECRVCAEDPDNNFLPTPGIITYVKSPQGPGVREDSSLFNGYEVTTFYDPMLSKIIVWGHDRHDAIRRMSRALSEYIVLGVKTNIGFLIRLMDNKDFISGKLDTGFIEEHKKLLEIPRESKNLALVGSAIVLHTFNGFENRGRNSKFKPWKYTARSSSLSNNSLS